MKTSENHHSWFTSVWNSTLILISDRMVDYLRTHQFPDHLTGRINIKSPSDHRDFSPTPWIEFSFAPFFPFLWFLPIFLSFLPSFLPHATNIRLWQRNWFDIWGKSDRHYLNQRNVVFQGFVIIFLVDQYSFWMLLPGTFSKFRFCQVCFTKAGHYIVQIHWWLSLKIFTGTFWSHHGIWDISYKRSVRNDCFS